jgi:hypothetical protein
MNNPGLICEHDLFNLLELFKEKDYFFVLKDLINVKDVPRDYG